MNRKRYLIALVPPEPVLSEIRDLKEECARKMQSKKALRAPAHITLIAPFEKEVEEELLHTKLAALAKQEIAFHVYLNGFDCFANRRFPVIYVKPEQQPRIGLLREALTDLLHNEKILQADNNTEPFHPHITIAYRDLTPAAFRQFWPQYQDRVYRSDFEVNCLHLLKWNFLTGRWDILSAYPFETRQLELL